MKAKKPSTSDTKPGRQKISLREQQKQFTRERFIDAAIETFSETGYAGATIDMITRRAGANRSTFYLHFKDKIELTIAINERMHDTAQITLGPLNSMTNPDKRKIRSWLNKFAQVWQQNHALFAALIHAQMSEPSIARKYYDIIAERLGEYLDQYSGAEREIARTKLILFFMQLETFFYTKISQNFESPSSREMNALTESAMSLLFE